MPDNPVSHPLAAPVVNGTEVTVDQMLQQPTRVTRYLADITLERFIIDRVFVSAGGVTGGAVLYDLSTENELYMDRDVEPVAPAQEFPIVTSSRRAPAVAQVEKYGGKFFITDEARARNNSVLFQRETDKLANTIVRKLNSRAVEVIEAAIAANGGGSTFAGTDWSAAVPGGSNPTIPASTPIADFAQAQLLADRRDLGMRFNVALVNPTQLNELALFYADRLSDALSDNGFEEIYSSNRVPEGSAYFLARGQVGEMRLEQPLATETWREEATQRTWVQSSVRPVMFVDNPFAIVKVTGL